MGPHNLRATVYILGKPYKQRGDTRARVVSNKSSNSTRLLIVELCILRDSAKFTCQQRSAVCADSGTKGQAPGASLQRLVGAAGCCGREKLEAQHLCCGVQCGILGFAGQKFIYKG